MYIALTVTPSKELETLEEPTATCVGEQRVFKHLQLFNKSHEVQKFLRFMTGGSVGISQPIKVTFNSLSGLAQ